MKKKNKVEPAEGTGKKPKGSTKSGERPHLRISQIAQVLEQRLRFIKGANDRHKIAVKYKNFLKERTKKKGDERKKLTFNF